MSAPQTFPRRILGDTFKQMRRKWGMSRNGAAVYLGISRDKLNSIESGNTKLSIMDIRGLCSAYEAPLALQHELIALADTRQKDGWTEQYGGGIPQYSLKYDSMEQRATELLFYESEFVAGLFQTERYIRAIQTGDRLAVNAKLCQRVVDERLARWEGLKQQDTPPRIRMILNEPVLTRQVVARRS